MPTLHLTKVAFACRDLDALKARVGARSVDGEVRVPTRMRPKRAEELVGGNLYWIVKHRLIGGLEIRRFEDRSDGRIDIVCSAELKVVTPQPRRAHHGWRYLEEADAPSQGGDSTASPSYRRDSTDASPLLLSSRVLRLPEQDDQDDDQQDEAADTDIHGFSPFSLFGLKRFGCRFGCSP